MSRKTSPRTVTPWRRTKRVVLTEADLLIIFDKTQKLLNDPHLSELDIPRKIQEKILEYGTGAHISERELNTLNNMFWEFGYQTDPKLLKKAQG